jgi:hypothetical protein
MKNTGIRMVRLGGDVLDCTLKRLGKATYLVLLKMGRSDRLIGPTRVTQVAVAST